MRGQEGVYDLRVNMQVEGGKEGASRFSLLVLRSMGLEPWVEAL